MQAGTGPARGGDTPKTAPEIPSTPVENNAKPFRYSAQDRKASRPEFGPPYSSSSGHPPKHHPEWLQRLPSRSPPKVPLVSGLRKKTADHLAIKSGRYRLDSCVFRSIKGAGDLTRLSRGARRRLAGACRAGSVHPARGRRGAG